MSTYGESDFELEESIADGLEGSIAELEESVAEESVAEDGYSGRFEADESAIQEMQKSGYSIDFEPEESMASKAAATPKSVGYSADFDEESVAASAPSFKPLTSTQNSIGYSADDFDEESMAASIASKRSFALQPADTPKSMGYSADAFDEESIAASVASRRISPRAALSVSKNSNGGRPNKSPKNTEYSQTLDGYSTNFDVDESQAPSPKNPVFISSSDNKIFGQSTASAGEYSQTFEDEYSQAFENDSIVFSEKGASKTVSSLVVPLYIRRR
jgi:hypothetical protein